MLPNFISDNLRGYVDEWQKAEKAIKQAEHFENALNITSVTELRYAGRRFTEVIGICLGNATQTYSDADVELLRNTIFEATQNCIRARNDAVDIIITFLRKYMLDLEDNYTVAVARSYFPKYKDIRCLLFDADDIIATSRQQAMAGRHEMYDNIQLEQLPKLLIFYREMVSSETLLQKEIEQAQRIKENKEANHKKNLRISWSISIICAIIAIGSLAVAIINFWQEGR